MPVTPSLGRQPAWPVISLEPLAAWALALALFLGMLALQLEMVTAGRPYPFLAFFPVILLAAWLCGRGPGTALAVASAAASWWFLIRSPGTLAWPNPLQTVALALFLATGVFAASLVAGLARDAARAQAALGQAEAALAAQRVLSAELQHRVANNLQVVSSALTLQARRLGGTPAAAALGDATRRLDALGRLHRTLVSVEAAGDAGRVLEELCRTQIEAGGDDRVALAMAVTPGLTLDPDRLTLVGLIASEAISNALKHGFADGGSGRLLVRLQAATPRRPEIARQLELEIRDTGAGLPEGFDLKGIDSLGLRIVQSMVQRLGGTLSLASEGGAVLRVVFPMGAAEQA